MQNFLELADSTHKHLHTSDKRSCKMGGGLFAIGNVSYLVPLLPHLISVANSNIEINKYSETVKIVFMTLLIILSATL